MQLAWADVPAAVCHCFGVMNDRVGNDNSSMAGEVGPPAKVDVLTKEPESPIEAAEGVPHGSPDQQTGAADRKNVALSFVLPLVLLTGFEAGMPASRAADRYPHFEEPSWLVPAQHLRADDHNRRLIGRGCQQGG
jgi:hypothetical protein